MGCLAFFRNHYRPLDSALCVAQLSAVELAQAIRGGAKPTDALEACLARFDSAMKYSGCMAGDFSSEAVRHTVKSALSGNVEPSAALTSNVKGALGGVPFVAALCVDVAGRSTTAGCVIMGAGKATEDAPVIAALRNAGAVFLGHSASSELNFGLCSTRNVSAPQKMHFAVYIESIIIL